MPDIVESNRGKRKLCHDGHLYVLDRLSEDETLELWRCHLRGTCKVRLYHRVSFGEIQSVSGCHSDTAVVEIAKRRTATKHRAEETQEAPARINNILVGASEAAQASLPVNSLLAKQINRKRKACSSAGSAGLPEPHQNSRNVLCV